MDSPQVRRAYKLRAYPTRPQETRAKGLLHDHCDLQRSTPGTPRRLAQAAEMDQLPRTVGSAQGDPRQRPSRAGPALLHRTAATLRRLDVVFGAFYKRVKEPDQEKRRPKRGDNKSERRIGFPRFKARQRFNQVLFVAGDGARWEPAGNGRWAYASFQAVGRLKSVGSR
jgi:hypothetical protein